MIDDGKALSDSKSLSGAAALMQKAPCYTTLSKALKAGSLEVRPLQEYF